MPNEPFEEIDHRSAPLSPDKPNVGAHPAACPVVGLGASAGGLEAFQNFLTAAPPDAGLAYVLVQHLDPNHESMLAELLSRRTPMPVRQVVDGMAIEPNSVYLIPPNASLVIEKARLRLSDFSEPRGFRRPIDVFFRSLATDQGANAACVVLSGTGGDGSEGLRAVKEAGGLTLVQDPATAKYDGMPKSAVATALVDKIMNVRDMPAAIRDYYDRGQPGVFSLPDITDFLLSVCEHLRHRLGHDFSQYKRSTMLRRIQRRMQVVGASSGQDYLAQLRDHPGEADLLFRDLLINVTCFFRDAEAFDYLRREVIPALLKGKGAGDTVRIWAPGCSSGEEAYSIAILVAEALARMRARPNVQILATDIDDAMLQKARKASYPPSAVREVPLELLDRYFFAQEDDYVLAPAIRDMVRISNHNLIKDPPFSRIDLIICRNLLIYLNTTLQQRLIPVFHYATHVSTARAMLHTEIGIVTPDEFECALRCDGHLAARVAAAADREFDYLRFRAKWAVGNRPTQRLASLLAALSSINAREGREAALIPDEIPSGAIAERLDVSIDDLAAALWELETRGLVAPSAAGLRIIDIVGLERLADANSLPHPRLEAPDA